MVKIRVIISKDAMTSAHGDRTKQLSFINIFGTQPILMGMVENWWVWSVPGAFGNNIIVHVLCCKHTNTSSMSSQMASLLPAIAEHAEHAVYEPCMVHIGCDFPMLILTDSYG